VAAGFPLVGGYGRVLDTVEAQVAAATEADREAWDADFDLRAVLAFYRGLAGLPASALVDGLHCPLFSFWGGRDEIIEGLGGLGELAPGLRRREVSFRVLDGLGHAEALLALETLLPVIIGWLEQHRE
jgi:hypothetical protein